MASQTRNPTQDSSTAPRVVTYVNQQLEKTRRQVKTTDLISGILKILVFVGCFLIGVALWDSWISPLSETVRWICFFILLAGAAYFFLVEILPLSLRKINPEYAAKMIEDAEPSFKNSLLNYVFLRRNEQAVSPVIFQAVSRQAATNLSSVPPDATVDRSSLIRLGMYLIGLTLFIVSYMIFSPKDPLQSFARILFPNAKIAHPARVRISDVSPGDTKVFFGDSVTVEAVVRGNHQPDDVYLLVSSTDGQIVNQRIAMQPESIANRYRAVIGEGSGGIQQALTYQVVALDGQTPIYDIGVQSQPTIAVESLSIRPPDYTQLPPQTLIGQGEIDVIEGTRITVEAVANMPIKNAYLDLMVVSENNREDRSSTNRVNRFRTVQTLNMDVDDQSAKIGFYAFLDAAREKPMATHYQLRFVSTDNDTNRRPNVYPIKIYPDLAPEIRILNPSQQDIEVPEDGQLIVDLEANDLDFEISYVTFSLNHQGIQLRQDEVDLQPINGKQRVRGRYRLVPQNLGLKSGDRAVFFVIAADNRTTPGDQQRPEPNLTRTDNYTLTVTDPRKSTDPSDQPQDDPSQSKPDPQKDQAPDKATGQEPDEQDSSGDQTQQDAQEKKQTGESGSESQTDSNEQSKEETEDSSQGNEGQSGAGGQQQGTEQQAQSDQSQSDQDQSSGKGQSSDSQADENDDSATGSGSQSDGSEQQESKTDGQSSGDNQKGQSGSGDSTTGSQASDSDLMSDPSTDSKTMDPSQSSESNADPSSDLKSDPSAGDSTGASDSATKPENESADANSGESTGQTDGQSTEDSAESTSQPGQRDSSDTDGDYGTGEGDAGDQMDSEQRQPLSKDATQREQFERLQELLDQQNSSAGVGDSEADEATTDQTSGDSAEGGSDGGSESSTDDQRSSESTKQDSEQAGKGELGSEESGSSEGGTTDDPKGETGQNQSDQGDGTGDTAKSDPAQTDSSQSDSSQSDASQGDASSGDPQTDGSTQQESDASESNDSKSTDSAGQDSDTSDPADTKASGESTDAQQDPGDSGGTPQPSDAQGGDSTAGSQAGSASPDQGPPGQATQPGQSSPGSGDGMQDSFKMEKEDPNLEHAKKATDLILKRLNEQKYEPDPKLLEEMNWTQDDLNNFLTRWEAMKRAAEQGDARAKRRYEQALRNLNFRDASQMRTIRQSDEQIEGLSQDSTVIQPPPEFAPGFKATLRDLNRNEE